MSKKNWTALKDTLEGKKIALRQQAIMSSNVWNVALPDEEGIQTRVSEMDTVALVLCKSKQGWALTFFDGTEHTIASDDRSVTIARAIHLNLVKVPEYCFQNVSGEPLFDKYLFGKQCAGFVGSDGTLTVAGLGNGYSLRYTDELGLVISKTA